MHYPALASAPGGLSAKVPVSTLLAGGGRPAVPVLSGSAKSGKENENCASSGVLAKDNSFDYIVEYTSSPHGCARVICILLGGFLASKRIALQ